MVLRRRARFRSHARSRHNALIVDGKRVGRAASAALRIGHQGCIAAGVSPRVRRRHGGDVPCGRRPDDPGECTADDRERARGGRRPVVGRGVVSARRHGRRAAVRLHRRSLRAPPRAAGRAHDLHHRVVRVRRGAGLLDARRGARSAGPWRRRTDDARPGADRRACRATRARPLRGLLRRPCSRLRARRGRCSAPISRRTCRGAPCSSSTCRSASWRRSSRCAFRTWRRPDAPGRSGRTSSARCCSALPRRRSCSRCRRAAIASHGCRCRWRRCSPRPSWRSPHWRSGSGATTIPSSRSTSSRSRRSSRRRRRAVLRRVAVRDDRLSAAVPAARARCRHRRIGRVADADHAGAGRRRRR